MVYLYNIFYIIHLNERQKLSYKHLQQSLFTSCIFAKIRLFIEKQQAFNELNTSKKLN